MMKQHIPIIIFILLSNIVFAQECNYYLPLEENRGLIIENYDRRDRLQGKQDLMVKEVHHHSDYIEARILAKHFDTRDRLQHEMEFSVQCRGGELILDIQSIIDQSMLAGFQGMEINMTTTDIMIPDNPEVGDQLPDANLQMTVSSAGIQISEMALNIQNRLVEAQETITTPAGSYECFKITYDTYTELKAMGIPKKMMSKGVEYLAPGLGTIRTEMYNDKGRLESYSVLSEIY